MARRTSRLGSGTTGALPLTMKRAVDGVRQRLMEHAVPHPEPPDLAAVRGGAGPWEGAAIVHDHPGDPRSYRLDPAAGARVRESHPQIDDWVTAPIVDRLLGPPPPGDLQSSGVAVPGAGEPPHGDAVQ